MIYIKYTGELLYFKPKPVQTRKEMGRDKILNMSEACVQEIRNFNPAF